MGEDEIADLLRAGILVDLYPVVRKSIWVGAGSYGLKAIEPLYLGHRQGEVTSGAGSITEYARYCALRDDGRAQEAAQVLNTLGEYNRLDCRSTQELRDWLLMRAFEPGITHLTRPVKKLGRIPSGGGWWAHGRGTDGHRAASAAVGTTGASTGRSAIDSGSDVAVGRRST